MKNDPYNSLKVWISVFVLLLVAPGGVALAHRHPAYSHDATTGHQRPRWMSHLPGMIFLSDLAMVGTHDTMSFYGGDAVQTQTMSLRTQLNAGVRALDIRLARVIVIENFRIGAGGLALHHGIVYQNADFDDVLRDVSGFLNDNPSETVLMRVTSASESDEEKVQTLARLFPTPVNNTPITNKFTRDAYYESVGMRRMERLLSFPEMFMLYANNPAFAGKFYKGDPFNLTLGNARGKIVLLRDFPVGSPVQVSFGLDYGNRVNYGRRPSETPRNPNAPFFMVQDEFSVTTNWDLYDKWIKIKTMINSVHSRINGGDPGGRGRVFLINYLSAAGGSFPYFIASGHSNPATGGPRLATGKSTPAFNSWKDFPRVDCLNKNGPRFIGPVCTIAFEGTNTLTEEHISRNIRRALPGILMADFPGQGLIDEAIALNFGRHRPANPVWQRSQ